MAQIVAAGGFVAVPEIEMEPGLTHAAVGLLRQRLLASGDISGDTSYPNYFGTELETAVKRFQASNGLAPTGVVDKRTIAALNVPAEVRLKQLKANLERLSGLVKIVGKRYVHRQYSRRPDRGDRERHRRFPPFRRRRQARPADAAVALHHLPS